MSVEPIKENACLDYKTQPYSQEAEQTLLGALLINPDTLDKVLDFIEEEHFYEPCHQTIYRAIVKVNAKGLQATTMAVSNYFNSDEFYDKRANWKDVVAYLIENAEIICDIEGAAKIIKDCFIRRQVIESCSAAISTAYANSMEQEPLQEIETLESDLFRLSSSGDVKQLKHIEKPICGALAQAKSARLLHQNNDGVTGIASGIPSLDTKLGGFQDSDLIILAARPSMGKTSLAVNIAVNAAEILDKKHQDGEECKSVALFSLEMSGQQLANRILSMKSSVDSESIRLGSTSETDMEVLDKCTNNIREMPLYIEDSSNSTIADLKSKIRRLKRKENIALVIVDYLQLITSGLKKTENRVQEISVITQGLKAIAKEVNIPIIALSQLSRSVEQRDCKIPQLSDLRDSGSIEQDADIVMFIYRAEYYLQRSKPNTHSEQFYQWEQKLEKVANKADLIIAKNRNGSIGNISLDFDSKTTTFKDSVRGRTVS